MGHQIVKTRLRGDMAERLKAPVLKTGHVKACVGSNPTISAKFLRIWGSTQEAEEDGLLNR